MEDFDNAKKYAVYRTFSVGDNDSGYRLTVGDYDGNAGKNFDNIFVCVLFFNSDIWSRLI